MAAPKTFGQKIKSGLRKVFAVALLGGVAGSPVYYEYGTIRNVNAKITGGSGHPKYDPEKKRWTNYYSVETDQGSFVDDTSWAHLKGKRQTEKVWNDLRLKKSYHLKVYGYNFGPLRANILDAQRITDEELAAQVLEQEIAKKKQELAQKNAGQKNGKGASPTEQLNAASDSRFSGNLTQIEMVKDGQRIKMLVPVEAAGNIEVVSVKPLVQTPPPPDT